MANQMPRVEAIFHDAVAICAPQERAAFLDSACGPEPDLRRRVEALLEAHDGAEGVLRLPSSQRTLSDFPMVTEGPGSTLGRYKLLEQIGEGGFGVVYMAEQQYPVRRKVALKVIKPGVDTRQVIARFEAERQALALMEHENIARVLDAGATDTGRPYFVMELVRGVPITEYCDKNQLPPRERIELFVQVCRAVQHAHTKGIIHRDIKPTNVLVTLHEGVAVPKVIDFGVAKAAGQQLTDKTLFTNFAQMIGTPLYMSPEQAEMTGIDVDTRSDIYSLGVLLYELLTGTTPLDKERLKQAAFDEVRRTIREEEPPRPSTRLSTMGEAAQRTISAQRKSDPKHLGRIVRGELDWIVMKALEKERARRYETANGLAADVLRYLHDEQVLACPPSATYRLTKLARKHRVSLAVAAGFLLLLVAGAVVSTYQAIRIRAEQEKTLAQKVEADRQRDDANRNRQAAQANERLAEERLAQGLASAGDALLSSNQIVRARAAYSEAMEAARKQGIPAPAALSGLAYSYHLSPAALMRMQIAEGMSISSVLFSPDGKTVAYVGGTVSLTPTATTAPTTTTSSPAHTGTIWLFDVVTGAIKSVLRGHTSQVRSLVFSRDGKLLLTGSSDGTARLWDVAAQHEVRRIDGRAGVNVVAFTPDEKQVVIGSHDQIVRVWDLQEHRQLRALRSSGTEIWTMALSPDGKLMALGGLSGQLNIYDFATGEALAVSRQFPRRGQINNVVFTPDSTGLLAAYWDHTLSLWDVKSGAERQRFAGPKANPRRGVFSHDGSRLVTTFDDGGIRIWDVATGQELKSFARLTGYAVADLSPDGQLIATSDLRLWDASGETDQSTFKAHERGVTCAALSPDGRIALTGDEIGFVKLWDLTTFKEIRAILAHGYTETVAFLPDGKHALTAGRDEDVKLWNLLDGRLLRSFPSKNHWTMAATRCAAVSPDGQTVVVPTDGGAQLYETSTGKPLRTIALSRAMICADFSPDGKTFLAGQFQAGSAVVCDVATGEIVRTFDHGGGLASVCFSPDGKSALTTGWDGDASQWDVASGKQLRTLSGHAGVVWCGRLSRDGALAITGSTDRSVRLWDLRTGQEIRNFPGHEATVRCVGFLPDGRAAWSGGIDGSFRLWRLGWPDEYRERYTRMTEAQRTLADRPNDPAALAEIGEWYAFRGRWDWAAVLLQRARAAGGTPSVLTLARCYWQLGKTTEAREEFDSAAGGTEANVVYASLAKSALQSSEKPQDPLEVMMRSLQGEPSYNLLDTANLHAYRLRQRNDLQNAVRLRAEVVNAAARKWPADFPVLMRYRLDFAEMLLGAGEYDRAEAVAGAVPASGAYPALVARAKGIIGRIAAKTGRQAAATTTAPSPSTGGDPWTEEMIASATLEANKLRADNRLTESENVQRRIIAQAKRIWPTTSSKVTVLQGVHASVLERLKRFGEAEALYHEMYSARMSESDPTNAKKVLVELAQLYELLGQPQKHVELKNLMSQTHLPAQFPAALARIATPPTSKPAATGPASPAPPTQPATTLQAK